MLHIERLVRCNGATPWLCTGGVASRGRETSHNAGLAGTSMKYRHDDGALIAQTKALLYLFRSMLSAICSFIRAGDELTAVRAN
jgi:hypothetical protein